MYTWQSKGRLLVWERPMAMGILNLTPDSFFNASRTSLQEIEDKAALMLGQGAGILDIGGQSTRPGATTICDQEELDRVLPAIETIKKSFPDCWLSIDTFYASVARQAVQSGADIINDISAGDDDERMLEVVKELKVPFIAMHKQGKPASMQVNPVYNNVANEVMEYFKSKNKTLSALGIYDWAIDPGFGFGKTLEHNYALMQQLETFQIFKKPVLVGISRKGMVQKALGVAAENALNGSTALHMVALMKHASILRVHDVKEAVECIELYTRVNPKIGL